MTTRMRKGCDDVLHRQHAFSDHLARIRADDVHAQDLISSFISEDFHLCAVGERMSLTVKVSMSVSMNVSGSGSGSMSMRMSMSNEHEHEHEHEMSTNISVSVRIDFSL